MNDQEISSVLKGWTQEGILGSGPFGTVYLARNTETGVFSAVKVIRTPPTKEAIDGALKQGIDRELLSTYFTKFKNDLSWELTMVKTVKSPHLIRAEDIVTVDAQGPGWTGYIRTGIYTPMATYFEKAPATQEDAARLGVELASALDALTQYGMVHGELKPENVFVNDAGAFMLSDFGVRRCLEKAGSGIFNAGEDDFEAPEVGAERRYTAQSDIYSLGALMCYTAGGCHMPQNRDPDLIRGIDPAFAAIIKKAMAADPKERYQTAMQLKLELERLELGKKPPRRAMAAAAAFDAVKKHGGAAIVSGAVITGRGVTRERPAAPAGTDTVEETARAGAATEKAERDRNSRSAAIIALAAALLVLAVVLLIWMPWRSGDPSGTDPNGTSEPSGSSGSSESSNPPVSEPSGSSEPSTPPASEPSGSSEPSTPPASEPSGSSEPSTPPASEPSGPSEPSTPPVSEPSGPSEPSNPPASEPSGPSAPNNDILFPSDKELITREFLQTKSRSEVGYILNEMYARHGMIFKAGGELQTYFESQKWYTPVTSDASKVVAKFNATEWANLQTITDYQREMGWRGGGSASDPSDGPSDPSVPPSSAPSEPPVTTPSTPSEPPVTAPSDPSDEGTVPASSETQAPTGGGSELPTPEDGYLYPSDKQVITREELEHMTRSQIGYILNEIYARHGYIFSTQEFKDYFESQPWYRPVTNNQTVIVGMFNDVEKQNRSILYAYQREMGWR